MNLLTKQRQTYKTKLWLPERTDSLRVWNGHIHTAIFKVDYQLGPTV